MLTIVEWTIYLVLGTLCGYLIFKLTQFSWIILKAIFGKRQKDLASQRDWGRGTVHPVNPAFLPASVTGVVNNISNTGNTYYPACNYDCGICINNLSCFWFQDVYLDDIDFNSTSTSCGQNDCIQQNHCGHGFPGDNYNCDLDGDGVPDYLDDDF